MEKKKVVTVMIARKWFKKTLLWHVYQSHLLPKTNEHPSTILQRNIYICMINISKSTRKPTETRTIFHIRPRRPTGLYTCASGTPPPATLALTLYVNILLTYSPVRLIKVSHTSPSIQGPRI